MVSKILKTINPDEDVIFFNIYIEVVYSILLCLSQGNSFRIEFPVIAAIHYDDLTC